MENKIESTNKAKKKGFFAKIADKLDKKLKEKSQSSCCSSPSNKTDKDNSNRGNSCC